MHGLILALKIFVSVTAAAGICDMYIVRTLKGYDQRFARDTFFLRNLGWAERNPIVRLLFGYRTIVFMKTRTVMFPLVEFIFGFAVIADLFIGGLGRYFYRDVTFLSLIIFIGVVSLRDRQGAKVPDVLTIPGTVLGLTIAWFI